MAGDWIPMRANLEDDPTVIFISRATKLQPDHVVGKLHRLWSWVDSHTDDGQLSGVDAKWIDHYVKRKGFAQAMANAPHPWLEILPDSLFVTNFGHWFGRSAKSRLTNTRRQQELRSERATESATNARLQDSTGQKRRDTPTPPTNSNLSSGDDPGDGGGDVVFKEIWERSRPTAQKIREIIQPNKVAQLSRTDREWVIRIAVLADRHGSGWLEPALVAVKSAKKLDNPKGFFGSILNDECVRLGTTLNRELASVKVPEDLLEPVAKRPACVSEVPL